MAVETCLPILASREGKGGRKGFGLRGYEEMERPATCHGSSEGRLNRYGSMPLHKKVSPGYGGSVDLLDTAC